MEQAMLLTDCCQVYFMGEGRDAESATPKPCSLMDSQFWGH